MRYGFDLAAYAVGWVPFVGWLAPQITIFYNFGERIVRSGVFNFADWIDGNGSFVQNLTEFGIDTVNSFIFLANDQLAFWLPPLPPIPPLPGGSLQATTLTSPAVQPAPTPITPKQAVQLAHDRFGAQTKALREVAQTAVGVTTTAALEAASAVTDVVSGETPLPKAVSDAVKQVRATVAETVPGTIADVEDFTAGNARLVKSVVAAPRTVAKGVVTAQGEVRAVVAKATTGVAKAAVSGEQGAVRTAVTDTPGTVAKGVSDGVKAATDGIKKVRRRRSGGGQERALRRNEVVTDARAPAPTARWMVTIDCGGPWPTPSTRSVGSDRDRDVAARNFLYAPFQCRGPRTHRARLAGDACRGDRSRPRTPCGDDHRRVQLEPAR